MSSRGEWLERQAPRMMVLPAVLLLLAFSLFPLIISAWLAVSRFRLEAGGYNIRFVGLRNFTKLLFGSEQYHFLGTFGPFSILGWAIFLAAVALLARWFWRYLGGPGRTLHGFAGRTVTITVLLGLLWIALSVPGTRSGPGSLVTTLFHVVAGVSAQFLIGLGLAWLCSQRIRGRTFFRLVFFLPLMVTPVGIGYTFRMVADMSKGPFAPIWQGLGVGEYSWAADAWSARWVVTIGETWQWVPFMFIVLLAAIESQPQEQVEAAAIDGAGGWEIFRDHLADDCPSGGHGHPDPADRGLQDHRPAKPADEWRTRNCHGVHDPPCIHRLARATTGPIRGDRLHAVVRRGGLLRLVLQFCRSADARP